MHSQPEGYNEIPSIKPTWVKINLARIVGNLIFSALFCMGCKLLPVLKRLAWHTLSKVFLSSNNMPELSTAWIKILNWIFSRRGFIRAGVSAFPWEGKINPHLNQGHKRPSRDLYSHLLEQWQNNESFLRNLAFPSELLLRIKWGEYQRSCWRPANEKTRQ